MQAVVLVVVLLNVGLVALLAWRLRTLDDKERALRIGLAELAPAESLPLPLDEAFQAGPTQLLTVEILNPLALARKQHRFDLSSGAPAAVRARAYEEAAQITRASLAERGVDADARIHAAG